MFPSRSVAPRGILRPLALLLLVGALVGCGTDEVSIDRDASADAPSDTSGGDTLPGDTSLPDTTPDVDPADTASDVDPADASPDADPTDTAPDTTADADAADATPDVAPDTDAAPDVAPDTDPADATPDADPTDAAPDTMPDADPGDAGGDVFDPGAACDPGDWHETICPDGNVGQRCECESGRWVCGELRCRDLSCDDGSRLSCRMMMPICEGVTIPAIQDECWSCVDPRTCTESVTRCRTDMDCTAKQWCDPCGTSSCPACDDCISACAMHFCPTETRLTCRCARPECPTGGVAVIRDGCWVCVDRETCGDQRTRVCL